MKDMIDWSKFPRTFTRDAIERYSFVPETPTHASKTQINQLMEDAQRYLVDAPYPRTAGLGVSARSVIRSCARALDDRAAEPRFGPLGQGLVGRPKRPLWTRPHFSKKGD